jgi:hypothetical protein
VRLVEAGADWTLRCPHEEYYKTTIDEVAALHEMQDYLQARSRAPKPKGKTKAKAKAKGKSLPPPQSLEECLQRLDDWLQANVPGVRLGPPQTGLSLPEPFGSSPGANDLLALLARVDDECDESLIPMAGEISYYLLPLVDGLEERRLRLQLQEAEGAAADGQGWQAGWLPIASNGCGDSLAWDSSTGAVLAFVDESRKVSQRAASLFELFWDLVSGLETGKYTYSRHNGIT